MTAADRTPDDAARLPLPDALTEAAAIRRRLTGRYGDGLVLDWPAHTTVCHPRQNTISVSYPYGPDGETKQIAVRIGPVSVVLGGTDGGLTGLLRDAAAMDRLAEVAGVAAEWLRHAHDAEVQQARGEAS